MTEKDRKTERHKYRKTDITVVSPPTLCSGVLGRLELEPPGASSLEPPPVAAGWEPPPGASSGSSSLPNFRLAERRGRISSESGDQFWTKELIRTNVLFSINIKKYQDFISIALCSMQPLLSPSQINIIILIVTIILKFLFSQPLTPRIHF